MSQIFNSNILILLLLTACWCFLHSALISTGVIVFLKRKLESNFRFYRIVYNLFSLVSFILLVIYEMKIRQEIIFHWHDLFALIRIFLFILVLVLFYFGAKQYSFFEFIGLNQLNKQKINLTISQSGELNTSGILGIIRHPWYLGTLIIIWLRDLSISTISLNIILSTYVIIGAYFEEKKLIREFGQVYIFYTKQVSMFIPFKWIFKSMIS